MSALSQIRDVYQSVFNLGKRNLWACDFALAVVLSSKFPETMRAVWGIFIAPPSHGKNALMEPFYKSVLSVFMSDLTDKTLLSGWGMTHGGEDKSLLPKLKGKCMITPEFSSILASDPNKGSDLHNQLKSAYDGVYTKAWGTGIKVFVGRFNILAGMVPELGMKLVQGPFGERFLSWKLRLPFDDRLAQTMHIARQSATRNVWAVTLKEMACSLIASLKDDVPQVPDSLPDDLLLRLATVADLVAKARHIPAPWNKHPVATNQVELAGRLIEQLTNLVTCRRYADDRAAPNSEDIDFACRPAWDSIPDAGERVLSSLLRKPSQSLEELAETTHLPMAYLGHILSQYRMVKLVVSTHTTRYPQYSLSPNTTEVLNLGWPNGVPQ